MVGEQAGDQRSTLHPAGGLTAVAEDPGHLDVDACGSLVAVDGTPLTWDPNGPRPELLAVGGRGGVGAGSATLGLVGEDLPPAVAWLAGDWRGSARPTDPWGAPLDAAPAPGPGAPTPGFLGELEVDGLVWLRNRAYDPDSRQFLSPDPLAGDPGSPVLAHPYHYAANDPIGHADPLGLAPMSIDAYQQYNKVTTGVQWKHIVFAAEVGLSVALMFTPLGPANAARMFAMAGPRIALGAGTKMAGMAVNVASSLTTSSVLLGTTSAGYESYDLTRLPGSDGQFTPGNVVASTISAVPYTVAGGFVAPVRTNPVSLVKLVP